jgi:serine/threonine protein kinase
MTLAEGQLIGSYHVISLLGQGGMATVYKAYHPKLDRYVALKMMHTSFLSDPQFVARFEREAQIIAKLEHPNIVPVHDYAEFDGQPYLVMKFIPGISLKDALSDGPLELRDTMVVMSAIAKALDYAHHHGVLHRDIKPSNIMLDTNATPYLTDFGLARTVQDGESSLSQGMLIGTPAYMSPEQAAGQTLDARSDLYSLGIVLYELLVGQAPFGGGSTYTTLHAHLTEPPKPPSSLNPEIPPAVELVLLRALSKDPDDRYPSAAAMYDDLRNALIQSNVRRLNADDSHTIKDSLMKPRPSSLLLRVDGEKSPKPASAPAARMSVPIPVQAPAARKSSTPQEKPKSSSNALIWVGVGVLIALVLVLIGGVLLNRGRVPNVVPTQNASTAVAAAASPTSLGTIVTRQSPTAETATHTPQASLTPLPTQPPLPIANRPTQGNQDQSPPNGGQNLGAGGPGLPPLDTAIEGYDIPAFSLREAESAVRNNPQDPVAYLALAAAQLQIRPPQPQVVEQTLQRGGAHSELGRYIVSVLRLLEEHQAPPDLLYPVYNGMMRLTQGGNLYSLVRNRAGAHLYDLALRSETAPLFMLTAIDERLDTSYDPLFPAMLARMFITNDNLRLAEAAINRSQGDSPEKMLVMGDLRAAQGDIAGAQALWEALANNANTPSWVRTVAQSNLD